MRTKRLTEGTGNPRIRAKKSAIIAIGFTLLATVLTGISLYNHRQWDFTLAIYALTLVFIWVVRGIYLKEEERE